MQRILIIAFIIIALLGTVLGGAWWFLQRTIASLPISELDYKISAFGYKHVRLEHLSFNYLAPAAEHNNMPDSSPQERIPFDAQDVFVTWEWHSFRPEVQIIEIGSLSTTIDHWPVEVEPDDDTASWRKWQLPSDWRLSRRLPHQLDIHDFSVSAPCDSRCVYSGYLHFSSENKERFTSRDEPQRSELNMQVSPHEQFNELEHVNIRATYEVIGQTPSLDFTAQSPMAFQLSGRQQVSQNNELNASYQLTYQANAHWLYQHLWQWLPEHQDKLEPYLNFVDDTLQLNTEIQAMLPESKLERWLNEVSGQAQLSFELDEQIHINNRMQLERGHDIVLYNVTEAQANGNFLRQLAGHINPQYNSLHSEASTLEALIAHPFHVLNQWHDPLELKLFSRFSMPPGTALSDWHRQATGRVQYELNSEQQLQLPSLGRIDFSSQGHAHLDTGIWRDLDMWLQGTVSPSPALYENDILPLDLGDFHYTLQLQQENIVIPERLPLSLALQNNGETQLHLHSTLDFNAKDMSFNNGQGQLAVQHPEADILNISATNMVLSLPFEFSFTKDSSYLISATKPAQLALNAKLNTDELPATPIAISALTWEFQGIVSDWRKSAMTAQLDAQTSALSAPMVRPVSWQWQGTLQGTPLAETPDFRSSGTVSNAPGIVIRYDAHMHEQGVQAQWRLGDIFWLAGNPISATFTDWPELLQLQRGRSRAEGKLSYVFDNRAIELSAQLELFDVAGIYDTLSFSGLRSKAEAEWTPEHLDIALPNSSVQRLEYGLPLGPGELAASYRAPSGTPMQGTLTVGANQLGLLNGSISLQPQSYQLSKQDFIFNVQLNQLDLARLLAEYPTTDLAGSGLLSGAIPLRWTPQGLSIEQGRIDALPPGGQLQYRSERAQQMAQSNIAIQTLMSALDDFHYSELQGDVSYRDDGTLLLGLLIEGRNPALERGRPVRLQITLEEDLPALLASLQLTNQLNEIIQERVQQRLIQGLRN